MTGPLQGLTAVIPALNEGATIGEVVSRALEAAERVLVVDDGSTDGTGEAARRAGALVLRHERPSGYDRAISEGLNEAFRLGAAAAVTLDADGQHRIEDMKRVAKPVLSGELVFCGGVRNRFNRPIEAFVGIFSAPIFGTKDPFCGLKCYHRYIFEAFGPFPYNLYIQTLPLVWIKQHHLKHRFLPIEVRNRADQPRFGTMVRANAKLLFAFVRSLRVYFLN